MLFLFKCKKNPFSILQHQAKPRCTAIAPEINEDRPIEEENTAYYDPNRFYPVALGDVLDGRYQVATKLGFGTHSTVWLARDLRRWVWSAERYVAVKICALDKFPATTATNELEVSQLVHKASRQHIGRHFVLTMLDSFTVTGQHGGHSCLVFDPLREPLWILRSRYEGNVFPSDVVKKMVYMILQALDYLHSVCHIVHTDLKLDNIMITLEDQSMLVKDVEDEFNHPLPQKRVGDRTICCSRNYGQMTSMPDKVVVTDLGNGTEGEGPHYHMIQSTPYRAPEVILETGWSYSADIWNLGVLLFEMLDNKRLFITFESTDPISDICRDNDHLALMIALLGPCPVELQLKGRRTLIFNNDDGSLREPGIDTANAFALEHYVHTIGGDDKRKFVRFLGRMLRWNPEDRSTAKELLDDPWLVHE